MKKTAPALCLRVLLLPVLLLLAALPVKASHIFGADLYYTYISGSIYRVTLTVYGDCSGGTFSNLAVSSPQILVLRNGGQQGSLNLSLQGSGTEVSPVCASQLNNTTCKSPNGTVTGVKRFVYTGNYVLSGTPALWTFRFDGTMGTAGGQAGRSAGITNINQPGTSVIALEATINTAAGINSSPTYTTIPTPFFCANLPQGYNPGAVDPNADSLGFALVSGLEPTGSVAYLGAYSATAPLGVSGSIAFSPTTGQLNFTPNIAQKSLVVSRVTEYRNGIAVGTSMREMTFVVLNTCNNAPPGGVLSNGTNVTIVDTTNAQACSSGGTINFSINPTDPNSDTVDVAWAGIPAGASFTVANNGTPTPTGTFTWNVAAVAPGTYTFYVTYTDRGCPLSSKKTTAYSVVVLPTPTITFALVSAATCTKKAVFTITPSSSGPRTLTFSQGNTVLVTRTNVTGVHTDSLAPGTYTARTTDANGCTSTISFTLASPPLPSGTFTATGPTCNGGSNGSVTVSGSNGPSPYEYAIGAGSFGSSGTFTGLSSGPQVISVRDANSCVGTITATVPETPLIRPLLNFSLPPCNAFSSGVISVSAAQGAAPYQYALGSGAYGASGVFSGLASGPYTIHIKDANNCIRDTLVQLPDSVRVRATVVQANILCYGASTGSFTLLASGTTVPYTYALGSGAYGSTNTFTGLPVGTLDVHIKDPNGCYLDTVVTLTQPDSIDANLIAVEPLCFAASNGSISVAATGGVPPYTYRLNGGTYTTSSFFSGLAAGTYNVTVRDANACTKVFSTTIGQPAAVVESLVVVRPSCFGLSDGSLTVSASGGTAPYTYAINGGAYSTNGAFTGLPIGTYTVSSRDANGCIKDTTLTLTQPAALGVTALVKNSRCTPLNNGQVILVATGGTTPYQYSVNSGTYGASATFPNLAPGNYTFSVQDANGCQAGAAATIVDSIFLHATATVTDATCYDSASGGFTIVGNSGLAPYTYSLNGTTPVTSGVFTGLKAGSKGVRILDATGCLFDTAVLVGQPNRLVPTVVRTQPLCFGDANGSITVNMTGGTPAYQFALGIAGAYGTAQTFTGLPAGPYTIRYKDANNCSGDTSFVLNQPIALRVDSVKVQDVLCFGTATGIVTVYARGGVRPYTYAANTSAFQADSNLKNLVAGPQLIRIRDANGCQVDYPVILSEPTQLFFGPATVTMPTCEGFADGAVNVRGTGGTPPYEYAPDGTNFDRFGAYPSLTEGVYQFTVRDAKGCRHDTTINLMGYPHIVLDGTTVTPVRCWGEANGAINLVVTGGVTPLRYQTTLPLPPGRPTADPLFDSLTAATYTIRITDAKGCFKDSTFFVLQPDSLSINPTIVANDCIGPDNAGAISTAVTGGNPPYQYAWGWTGAAGQNGTSVANLPNGIYPIIVTDTKGCADTIRVRVGYDDCCKPFVPNAFTPNGDGSNDTWKVFYKGDMKVQNLSVYNRMGQRLFVSANLTDQWDGTFEGKPVDAGVYFYYLKIICGDKGDNIVEFKGDVTLIR